MLYIFWLAPRKIKKKKLYKRDYIIGVLKTVRFFALSARRFFDGSCSWNFCRPENFERDLQIFSNAVSNWSNNWTGKTYPEVLNWGNMSLAKCLSKKQEIQYLLLLMETNNGRRFIVSRCFIYFNVLRHSWNIFTRSWTFKDSFDKFDWFITMCWSGGV